MNLNGLHLLHDNVTSLLISTSKYSVSPYWYEWNINSSKELFGLIKKKSEVYPSLSFLWLSKKRALLYRILYRPLRVLWDFLCFVCKCGLLLLELRGKSMKSVRIVEARDWGTRVWSVWPSWLYGCAGTRLFSRSLFLGGDEGKHLKWELVSFLLLKSIKSSSLSILGVLCLFCLSTRAAGNKGKYEKNCEIN